MWVQTPSDSRDTSDYFQQLRGMLGEEMRPTLMREAFEKYVLDRAKDSLPAQGSGGESKGEESAAHATHAKRQRPQVVEFFKYKLRF